MHNAKWECFILQLNATAGFHLLRQMPACGIKQNLQHCMPTPKKVSESITPSYLQL